MASNESLEHLIDAYCAAWSGFDPVRRERMPKDVWDEKAAYTAPRGAANGLAELAVLGARGTI